MSRIPAKAVEFPRSRESGARGRAEPGFVPWIVIRPRPVRPKNASVPCPANQPSSRHDGPLDPGHCKITGQLGRRPTLVATLDCDPGDLYRDPGYFIAILWSRNCGFGLSIETVTPPVGGLPPAAPARTGRHAAAAGPAAGRPDPARRPRLVRQCGRSRNPESSSPSSPQSAAGACRSTPSTCAAPPSATCTSPPAWRYPPRKPTSPRPRPASTAPPPTPASWRQSGSGT